MEMIILIGCFWELELEYTSKCVYKQTGFETRFFVPIRIFMLLFFFFFFLRNISLAVAFQISCVFFSSPILKKEPFSVRFFEGEKKKREKKRAKKMEILRHLRISFFFHSFFNKCVYFLYGCFERKILFLLREICNARIYNYYYTCIII